MWKRRELPTANVVTAWFYCVLAIVFALLEQLTPPEMVFGLRVITGVLPIPGWLVVVSLLGFAWMLAEDRPPGDYLVWMVFDLAYVGFLIYGTARGQIALIGLLAILYYIRSGALSVLMTYERTMRMKTGEEILVERHQNRINQQRIEKLEAIVARMQARERGNYTGDYRAAAG